MALAADAHLAATSTESAFAPYRTDLWSVERTCYATKYELSGFRAPSLLMLEWMLEAWFPLKVSIEGRPMRRAALALSNAVGGG